jgi:hypothetical protein
MTPKSHPCDPLLERYYEPVGLLRRHWRGLSGGEAVWVEIEQFFARIRKSAGLASQPAEVAHA